MVKKVFYSAAVLTMLLLTIQTSYAAVPFSNTVDFFSGSDSFTVIGDNSNLFTSPYAHTLTGLNSSTYDLLDATLSLNHRGNSNNAGEVWFANTNGNFFIGYLSQSTAGNNFVLDPWSLGQSILDEIESTDPWSLMIKLVENTTGTDRIQIDYSILSGNYSPLPDNSTLTDLPAPLSQPTAVPEPGTLLLLGAGLIIIALVGNKFRNKKK